MQTNGPLGLGCAPERIYQQGVFNLEAKPIHLGEKVLPNEEAVLARFAVDSTHGVTIARPQYIATRIVNQNEASAVVLGTYRMETPPNRAASTSFMQLIAMMCVGKRDDVNFETSAMKNHTQTFPIMSCEQ